jgi:putative spermidine/putrescine transport system substrate-binding protein
VAVSLGQLLSGCNGLGKPALTVRLLKGSVPPQLLREFRRSRQSSSRVNFVPLTQVSEGFTLLQSIRFKAQKDTPPAKSPVQPQTLPSPQKPDNQSNNIQSNNIQSNNIQSNNIDLISLGDAWVAQAIRQNLITPLSPQDWSNWATLPDAWKALAQRNSSGLPDPQGAIWGAPYRWGSTVIVYRRSTFKKFGWVPQDWADLWRPEIKGKLSLLDHPRETVGLTLKKLGASYNEPNPDRFPQLPQALAELHQQVKFYATSDYLQPLLLEDTDIAVGWSADILPILKRDNSLGVVFPRSGSALWADLWVRPTDAQASNKLASEWINFCWSPEAAPFFSALGTATSPRLDVMRAIAQGQPLNGHKIPQKHPELLVPEADRLAKSEFILPLPLSSNQQYQALWETMRNTPSHA